MCPCYRQGQYVCTECFNAIQREAKLAPSDVAKRWGWKCDVVLPDRHSAMPESVYAD